jgi:hypothetical protein
MNIKTVKSDQTSIELAANSAIRHLSKYGRERQELIRDALVKHWDIRASELDNLNTIINALDWLRPDSVFQEAIVFMRHYVSQFDQELEENEKHKENTIL